MVERSTTENEERAGAEQKIESSARTFTARFEIDQIQWRKPFSCQQRGTEEGRENKSHQREWCQFSVNETSPNGQAIQEGQQKRRVQHNEQREQ